MARGRVVGASPRLPHHHFVVVVVVVIGGGGGGGGGGRGGPFYNKKVVHITINLMANKRTRGGERGGEMMAEERGAKEER